MQIIYKLYNLYNLVHNSIYSCVKYFYKLFFIKSEKQTQYDTSYDSQYIIESTPLIRQTPTPRQSLILSPSTSEGSRSPSPTSLITCPSLIPTPRQSLISSPKQSLLTHTEDKNQDIYLNEFVII